MTPFTFSSHVDSKRVNMGLVQYVQEEHYQRKVQITNSLAWPCRLESGSFCFIEMNNLPNLSKVVSLFPKSVVLSSAIIVYLSFVQKDKNQSKSKLQFYPSSFLAVKYELRHLGSWTMPPARRRHLVSRCRKECSKKSINYTQFKQRFSFQSLNYTTYDDASFFPRE